MLDRQDGPAILVGHSWGGTVITEAAEHPNVGGLVYVAAPIPEAGQTTAEQYEGFAATPNFVIDDVGPGGFGFLNPETFKIGFAADASDAEAAFLRDAQVPINMAAFGAVVEHAAWRTRPTWAVIATEDQSFDAAMLAHMAQRAGARVTKISASHAVFLTQAAAVADVIDEAGKTALS